VLPRGAIAELSAALADDPRPRAIWLQGSGCDGCAISFLNSVHFATPDEVLTQVVAAEFQSNLMAAAGDLAVDAAIGAAAQPGYILIVEGAIPTRRAGPILHPLAGDDHAPGDRWTSRPTPRSSSPSAPAPVTAASPEARPTRLGPRGVGGILGDDPRLVNLPGCPAHPDWLVGTLTSLITTGALPPLDEHRRPLQFYADRIHDNCFKRAEHCGTITLAPRLGEAGCMEFLGCKGKHTRSDCPIRKWNGRRHRGIRRQLVRRGPLTLPRLHRTRLPDLMSPFYEWRPAPRASEED
jgi:hydrogenase small subunit